MDSRPAAAAYVGFVLLQASPRPARSGGTAGRAGARGLAPASWPAACCTRTKSRPAPFSVAATDVSPRAGWPGATLRGSVPALARSLPAQCKEWADERAWTGAQLPAAVPGCRAGRARQPPARRSGERSHPQTLRTVVDHCVLDNEIEVGSDAHIGVGEGNVPNQLESNNINSGITIVGQRAHSPARTIRSCRIDANVTPAAFTTSEIVRGGSVLP